MKLVQNFITQIDSKEVKNAISVKCASKPTVRVVKSELFSAYFIQSKQKHFVRTLVNE